MLSFREFQEYCKENIVEYLPEEFKGSRIDQGEMVKNNDLKIPYLTVWKNGCKVAPTIYLEPFYEKYQKGVCLSEIMENLANECVRYELPNGVAESIMPVLLNAEIAKERVVMTLVNCEMNQEFLKDVPHMTYGDLAVYFRLLIKQEGLDETATVVIHESHMEYWGMNLDQIFELAMENTRRLLGTVVLPMDAYMRRMGEPAPQDFPFCPEMYVISNKRGCNGAISAFYEDVLDYVAKKVGSEFFLIPSSVHEWLAVPCTMQDRKEEVDMVEEMIVEVNANHILPQEVLSNNAYYYNSKTRQLMIAKTKEVVPVFPVPEDSSYFADINGTEPAYK